MLDNLAEGPKFFKDIIAGDVTCIYEYDIEIVQRANEWRSKNYRKIQTSMKALKALTPAA